jgi:O-antigen/teichoic acid export membrane protein
VRHAIIYAFGKLLPGALGFITTAVLTRLLDPEAYGAYGLGLAIIVFVNASLFEWLGLSLLRFYANDRDRPQLIATTFVIFLACCAISAVIAAVALLTPLASDYAGLILVSLAGSWTYAWFELRSKILIGALRAIDYLWMNLSRGALMLCLATLAALTGGGAIAVLLGSTLAQLLASFLYPLRETRMGPQNYDRDQGALLLGQGFPIAAALCLGAIGTVGDRVLLEALAGLATVGFFTAAWLIAANSIQLLSAGIGSATYSLAVRAVEAGDASVIDRQLSENIIVLLCLLLPAGIGLACIAPNVAYSLVGEDFIIPVSQLTPWLAASAVVAGIRANYFDHAFYLGQNTRRLLCVKLVGSLVNIVCNLWWIPIYGAKGAVLASFVANSIALAHGIILGRSCYRLPVPAGELLRISLATATMAVLLLLLPDHKGLSMLAFQVFLGALVYAAAILALNVMNARSRLREWLSQV